MSGSAIREKVCSDRSFKMKSFTYRLISDHEGPRGWTLVKSRYQSEDLELIL